MKYESSIFKGLKVMAKVKVFVYAANADADADADADGKGYDISSPNIRPGSLTKLTYGLMVLATIPGTNNSLTRQKCTAT